HEAQPNTKRTFGASCFAYSPQEGEFATAELKLIRLWQKGDTISHAFTAHDDNIECLAYSDCGQVLASGSHDNTVKLWRKIGPPEILIGHEKAIMCLLYLSDYREFVSGSMDKTIRLWREGDSEAYKVLSGHKSWVNCLAYSEKSQEIASGSTDGTIRLWRKAEDSSYQELTGHKNAICCLAYSPNGKHLASGSDDKTIRIWSQDRKKPQTLAGHYSTVRCLAYSSSGDKLASGSADGTVRLWESQTGRSLQTITLGWEIYALQWYLGHLAIAGRDTDNFFIMQHVVYQYVDTKPQLVDTLHRESANFERPFERISIEKSKGLTESRYRFLKNQGATGKPLFFAKSQNKSDYENNNLRNGSSVTL
ncbi:MAG: WD40 repeat domain-containing protein, partial [Gammaproteobacteria bacterium]